MNAGPLNSALIEMIGSDHAILRAVFEATPECIKIVAPDGSLVQMNPAGRAMIEAPEGGELQGACVFDLIAPEFRQIWRENHRRVCAGDRLTWEFDIIGLAGTRRHMETHAVPLEMPDGTFGQLALTRDITQRKDAERQQRLLIDELNHRVKNTLATVQSLMIQSAPGAANVGDYRKALGARIIALSHAHDQLSRRSWDQVDVRELADAGLAPYEGHVLVTGAATFVSPKSALLLSLAFHELADNAVRFGALSIPEGHVDLNWYVDGAEESRRFHLTWTERGGPAVGPRIHSGFGSRLLERGFASELNGAAHMDFIPAGLLCSIEFPLENVG
jgi:PAS domain S-box-containing protein